MYYNTSWMIKRLFGSDTDEHTGSPIQIKPHHTTQSQVPSHKFYVGNQKNTHMTYENNQLGKISGPQPTQT